jgi:hypothetical protein
MGQCSSKFNGEFNFAKSANATSAAVEVNFPAIPLMCCRLANVSEVLRARPWSIA